MNKQAVINIYPGANALKDLNGVWSIHAKTGAMIGRGRTAAAAWANARAQVAA